MSLTVFSSWRVTLSNLDLKLREQMRIELKRIQREVGITSVYVTHDQAEALALSDEIVVMSKGRIEQTGSPHDVYARPANRYVSGFVGVTNLLPAHVVRVTAPGRGEIEVYQDDERVRLPCLLAEGLEPGDDAVLAVRPENVKVRRQHNGEPCLDGEVVQTIFLGNCLDCRVRWGTFEWKVLVHPRERLRPGERVYLCVSPEHSRAVPAGG